MELILQYAQELTFKKKYICVSCCCIRVSNCSIKVYLNLHIECYPTGDLWECLNLISTKCEQPTPNYKYYYMLLNMSSCLVSFQCLHVSQLFNHPYYVSIMTDAYGS